MLDLKAVLQTLPTNEHADEASRALEAPFEEFSILRIHKLLNDYGISVEEKRAAFCVLLARDYYARLRILQEDKSKANSHQPRTLEWYAENFDLVLLRKLPAWLLFVHCLYFKEIDRDNQPLGFGYDARFGPDQFESGRHMDEFWYLITNYCQSFPQTPDLTSQSSELKSPQPFVSTDTDANVTETMLFAKWSPWRNVKTLVVLVAIFTLATGFLFFINAPPPLINIPNLPPEPIADPPKLQSGLLRELKGHKGMVWQLAFSPDGQRLLSGSNSHYKKVVNNGIRENHPGADNTVRTWDIISGDQVGELQGHRWEIMGLTYCSRNSALAAACSSTEWATDFSTPTIVAYKSGTIQRTLTFPTYPSPFPSRPAMRGIAMSPDGTQVLACRGDGTLVTWNLNHSSNNPVAKSLGQGEPQRSENGVWCATFSADRQRIFGGLEKEVAIWNTSTGEYLKSLPCPRILTPKDKGQNFDRVVSIALSVDEKRLVSSSDDYTIRVWNVESGKQERTLIGHDHVVGHQGPGERRAACVTFSPDGRRILTGGIDSTLRVWDAETGEQLAIFHGHTGAILAVAVSPNGHTAATGGFDKTIRLWQLP